jgi:hypothetical protein
VDGQRVWRFAGGILWLLELAESHPSEIRADFRSHFSFSFDDVGRGVTYFEALHLVRILLRDPASWLQAARSGWKNPTSSEWMLLAELFDLTHQVNSKKKVKPIPRPWLKSNAVKSGKAAHSRSTVLKNLERMNPKES